LGGHCAGGSGAGGIGPFTSDTEAKRNIVEAVKRTAERLGNRPATCRKYYVHPAIMDAYLDGSLIESLGCASESTTPPSSAELHPEEKCIVKIIAKQAKAAAIP
jgi:DNA topoisomerase I